MNFFEILILLLFVVLPLLQQVLGKRGGAEPGEQEIDLQPDEDQATPEQRRAPAGVEGLPSHGRESSDGGGGWSQGWGEWPTDIEEAPAEARLDEIGERPRAEPAVEEAPARPRPDRSAPKVVSLEPLHVDRRAEHARFHGRVALPRDTLAHRPPRGAALLAGSGGLRRAVLAAEVLGTPVGLRRSLSPVEPD